MSGIATRCVHDKPTCFVCDTTLRAIIDPNFGRAPTPPPRDPLSDYPEHVVVDLLYQTTQLKRSLRIGFCDRVDACFPDHDGLIGGTVFAIRHYESNSEKELN